jgi:hypothetical protein
VRVLVFHEGFDQDDLARLLEILSLRYSGIHQHEDDMVTLLWKAGLRSLDVVAVEGFAPERGRTDDGLPVQPSAARPYRSEEGDLPLPPMPAAAAPMWVEVTEEARSALAVQASAAALPEDCLRLATLLTRGLHDPKEEMAFSEVRPLMEEVRDFLLCAERLPTLIDFVRLLRSLAGTPAPWDETRGPAVVQVIAGCGTDAAVRHLIHSVPAGQRKMRREMVEFLDLVCPDPFGAVADALAAEEHPSGRAVARQLVEHYGPRRASILHQRFAEAQGRVAGDILRSLARLPGGASPKFLARQCGHADPEVRAEALWHLERMAYTGTLGPVLVEAYRRTGGDHRHRILAVIERSGDRRFVEPLASLLASSLDDPVEAMDLARVLGRLEGQLGLPRWREWLRPLGRFLRRRLPGSVAQQAAAAAAVAEIPGDEATSLLERTLALASAETRSLVAPLLERRSAGAREAAA